MSAARRPTSTYRLQIRESFTLFDAAALVPYLSSLGVDTVYLSPILTAASGSDHGYDVVDPTTIDQVRGGADGLVALSAAAREHGMGVIADIVPNHMGIANPRENAWWWDVLTHGRDSTWAGAFDIDWAAGQGRVLVPILGAELSVVLANGELTIDTDADVMRYYDHELPLAPGSLDGTDDDIDLVLERQNWRLAFWQHEATELNFRRFFAVTTLAAVRVEEPWVFDASHAEIIRWVREGLVDGLRVDHPDGLADPGAYLDRLREATGTDVVFVEKILEHAATDHPEALPSWWATLGTTGYDAMAEIDRVLIDPAGEAALTELDTSLRAESGLVAPTTYAAIVHETKRMIADTIQRAEIARLARLLPNGAALDEHDEIIDALAELLTGFPVYRSYVPAGAAHLAHALREVHKHREDLFATSQAILTAVGDPTLEVSRRFMQTTGPVMAKGVEDTAFYRWTRLGTLTEVGGDPSVFAVTLDGLHRAFASRQAQWPSAMTSLSTHDTKRGEDVRARLSVLAERADDWAGWLAELRARASTGHGPFDALLWQAIIGSWPATPDRLHAYAEKAAREASERTTWWTPDADFEAGMHRLVDAAFADARPLVEHIVAEIAPAGWSNSLAAKLIQLTGPGSPDVYQGSEFWEMSLVDPDNRRAVDFAALAAELEALDAGDELPAIDSGAAAKLLVTSRALRLRRDRPELFSGYRRAEVIGAAADRVIAFDRGGALTVATRFPTANAHGDGWRDTAVAVPTGSWIDVITQRTFSGGLIALAELTEHYPVALLAPSDHDEGDA